MNITPPSLLPLALIPLPLGQISPKGWLLDQLLIQAKGLSGHIDEFWPDVRDSGWIGGDADGWERGPYWLDGIIPLACLLQDARLLAKVKRWINHIITHQHADGWIGPEKDFGHGRRDPWPTFIALKALTQWADASRNVRIIPAIQRILRRLDAELTARPLQSWAWFRWGDLLLSIYWLQDRAPEPWLLDMAAKVQHQGFDWRALFENYPYQAKTIRQPDQDPCTGTHGVNNAMAIKCPALWHRQSHDPADRQAAYEIIRKLDQYHGQITGMFSCDSHLAGRDPSQGAELCAIVEYMFSLETLLSAIGDPAFADRLERIAFNALPATFTEDMWAHQYDQQVNQVICQSAGQHPWTDNGPDANLFGLEPNFGCCAANMHQGWPKFAASLWMKTPDDGLAAISYCPCEIKTRLPSGEVTIRVEGSYPFHAARIIVQTRQPVEFPLLLRVPEWAAKPAYSVDGGPFKPMSPVAGFHRIEGGWSGTSEIEITFGKRFEILRRFNASAAILRGPLIMAMPIAEQWRRANESRNTNWEVLPTTAWNYGLSLDEQLQDRLAEMQIENVSRHPFSPKSPPLRLTVPARQIPTWTLNQQASAPLPPSPTTVEEGIEEITLIPYGCTHLRITEFPVVEPKK